MNVINYMGVMAKSAALSALLLATGCASIVDGTTQVVSVETVTNAGKVDGASCKLQNTKGVYFVTTPGTVAVRRAYGDMNVSCEMPGFPASQASVKSTTKAMVAGNILFGGLIGASIDTASGAAYDYPAVFQIRMNDAVANAVLPQPQPVPVVQAAPAARPVLANTVSGLLIK